MGKISWKITAPLIAVAVIIVIKYNTMLTMEESFNEQWENVESQCQRRADLIPKLVRTVKGSALNEEAIIKQLTGAKEIAAGVKIDAFSLTNDNIRQFQFAQSALNIAITDLIDLATLVPELKNNQKHLDIAAKLEGEGNRINVEIRRFNEQVKLYNTYIRKFPNNLVAGMLGFEKQASISAGDGIE